MPVKNTGKGKTHKLIAGVPARTKPTKMKSMPDKKENLPGKKMVNLI
jgi:hypothetical protein